MDEAVRHMMGEIDPAQLPNKLVDIEIGSKFTRLYGFSSGSG